MTDAVDVGLPEEILDSVPELRGRPRTVEPLPGGLTNVNYKVSTPAGRFVVRHFAEDTSALAIDRHQEHRNSVTAAAVGVGAPVVAFVPQHHVLVVGFIDGVTFDNSSFQVEGTIARVATAVRTLHSATPFANEFNMFRIQRFYQAIVLEHGYWLPPGYLDFAGQVERIERALNRDPAPLVPCNNDLLAGNFIDAGDRIRIIDYEYSGNNDACFELGNLATECGLSRSQLDELVTSYFGRPDPAKRARAELQALMSQYGWTLWGSIQAATSPIDYDFHAWGQQRYELAAATFTSDRFDRLLDQVAAPR